MYNCAWDKFIFLSFVLALPFSRIDPFWRIQVKIDFHFSAPSCRSFPAFCFATEEEGLRLTPVWKRLTLPLFSLLREGRQFREKHPYFTFSDFSLHGQSSLLLIFQISCVRLQVWRPCFCFLLIKLFRSLKLLLVNSALRGLFQVMTKLKSSSLVLKRKDKLNLNIWKTGLKEWGQKM